jgi:hypothetical protein
MFPQEVMIQPILQNGSAKVTLKESSGITVHPGDSLYLEVTSTAPSQVDFFNTLSPINVTITDGSETRFQETFRGVVAFNKANIVRTQAHHFQHGRRLVLNIENTQGLREIVLPIK